MYKTYDPYSRGFYNYKNKNVDVKTHYTVEYTMDKRVFDMMGTTQFDFSMFEKRDFDYLEDAVSFWNKLYYSEQVLYVMLFEQILLDGEVVLEQGKDMVVPSVLDEISKQRVNEAEETMKIYQKENEMLLEFLAKFGITKDRIRQEIGTYS